jgi:hypothetical protein
MGTLSVVASTEVWNEVVFLSTLAVGGVLALVALLRLATFSWRDSSIAGAMWLISGVACTLLYAVLAVGFSHSGTPIMLASATVTGSLLLLLLPGLEPRNKRARWWVPYLAWLCFWATALIGWRSGWLGLLTVTLPALLIAACGLFFVAGFLLPFPEPALYRGKRPARDAGGLPTLRQETLDFLDLFRYPRQNQEARNRLINQRRRALRCLLTYTLGTNHPYYVVVDGKTADRNEQTLSWETGEDELIKRVDGDNFGAFLSGPGIVLTGCDHAVAFSTGLKFKGARGPGVILTSTGDRPAQVIDLRHHFSTFPVEAWTKDGISIRVSAYIPFRIGAGHDRAGLGKAFPYRSSDVFRAIHAQVVEGTDPAQAVEDPVERKWYDLVSVAGKRVLRDIISRYEFDGLYAPFEWHEDPSKDPRSTITKELQEGLRRVLPDWGIQLLGAEIGDLMPTDPRVQEQRVEAWRADWTRKIMQKKSAGQARRLRVVETARAQAQIDVITTIGKRIDHLRSTGTPISMDAVARYFIQVLEELAGKPALRELLPGDMNAIIRQANRAVESGPPGLQGEQPDAAVHTGE